MPLSNRTSLVDVAKSMTSRPNTIDHNVTQIQADMEQESDNQAQETTTKEEKIFQCAEELHYIAQHARLQAYEAEMRADYAISMADRAVEESQAVQDIAESLTSTARIVAKISLDEKIDPKGIFTSIINQDVSKEFPPESVVINGVKYKPRKLPRSHPTGWYPNAAIPAENLQARRQIELIVDDDEHHERCDKISPLANSNSVSGDPSPINGGNLKRASSMPNRESSVDESESMHSSRSIESAESLKYYDSFPDNEDTLDSKAELIRSLDSAETLPIVYEDSYQGPRENRSIPWSEKKSLRKLQRKLKDLEMSDEDDSVDEGQGSPESTTVIDHCGRSEVVKQEEMSMEEDSSTENIVHS